MKYYEDKSDRKMELKLLSLSEDDKLIRECMEQASAFYGCLGKMGVTEILCDRKKAQELGADCQITGIFTGGELTAFACAFEYTGLKRNGRKWLNPGDKEWRQIETLGTNVVVIPLLVGKEKVGRLIELLREQYRDSHLLFRISGEQSEKFQEDLAVVSEKNLKSHRYDAAGENVWLFHFAPQIRMEDTYFEEEILLILPGQEVLLAEVLAEGIDYISSLCEAFQNFYTSFENRIEALDRRIAALSKKYGNTAGRTSRYVCATPNCFQRLLKEMPYTGSSITIDKELAEEIYNKVRNYSMLKDKPENGGYFEQIFDNGIIGYFKKSLMEIYGSTVNMDVLTALEKEAKYEKNEYDATRIEQYVKKVIAETRNLSNPFIERPLGEQKAPIAACTYSKELDPKDDSPRSMLIAKELGNYGGTPDEDIPLNMIMFYQSIYGLRANKLSKFSPGCAAEGRSDGEYYKAYYEVVSQIKPKSDKTPVITPHIDRNWHIVSALPDLDEENQRRQEREIYRAFALGIICDLVCYSKISEGKYLYRLELNDLEPEEFVVSNGTPCDHYYEVLDALTINPVAVQTILSYMKEKFADERNSSGKLDFEHSYLRRQINELASIEYGKAGLSIFDVALLLKVSTPSAEFDKTVGKGIMREILTLIYEYAQTMVLEADLDRIYGKFVLEQFEMFDKNIDWYMDNWKDNFSDYINDLMRIAVSDIERKKLTDIYEKMRKIMKESSKKRG